MIGIINYGSGNIQAIANIYNRSNIDYKIIERGIDIKTVDKLILPGVGAFDATMSQMINSGLKDQLDEAVLVLKKPILGICVGMQIMAKSSEEGVLSGLAWIDGVVRKFDKSKLIEKPYLPHMGWNTVVPALNHMIFDGIDLNIGFYFVHSYYFETFNNENILGLTNYGNDFVSAIIKENIFGFQFHPEKSHENGIRLLSNFARL